MDNRVEINRKDEDMIRQIITADDPIKWISRNLVGILFIVISAAIYSSCDGSENCNTGDVRECDLEDGNTGMQLCSENEMWRSCDPRVHILTHEERNVLSSYTDWASAIRNHSYENALSYVVAGSNFEATTQAAREQWNSGLEFYYDFDCLEIYYGEEDELVVDYAEVAGNWVLNQGPDGPGPFEDGFLSSATKAGGNWKLDGFNSQREKNWFYNSMRENSPCPNCSSDCGPSPGSWE